MVYNFAIILWLPTVLHIFVIGLCNIEEKTPAQEQRIEKFVQKVIQLTNKEREKEGLPPLKRQDELTNSANWFANDMAVNKYFSHFDSEGRDISKRAPHFQYGDYWMIGENVANMQDTPEEVLGDWMRSPTHRANILNPEFTDMGAGFANPPHSKAITYWVQDFGVRPNILPVIINDNDLETTQSNVRLYVHGKGWADEMRFSNDNKNWSDWEPFQTQKSWKLEAGEGSRTVYVEQRRKKLVKHGEDSIIVIAKPVTVSVRR